MQKVRGGRCCPVQVVGSFSALYYSRYFSSIPSRYSSLSRTTGIPLLEGGPPFFKQKSFYSVLLRQDDPSRGPGSHRRMPRVSTCYPDRITHTKVRSPLLFSSRLICVPNVTKMFQFTLLLPSRWGYPQQIKHLKVEEPRERVLPWRAK